MPSIANVQIIRNITEKQSKITNIVCNTQKKSNLFSIYNNKLMYIKKNSMVYYSLLVYIKFSWY